MSTSSILDLRKHCFCSRGIDVYVDRPTWRPIFGTLLTKILTFNLVLLTQEIKPSVETCCYTNVVSWNGGESKAINKIVIVSTKPLPLDHVADSAYLDKIMKFIFNDAMLLEVS